MTLWFEQNAQLIAVALAAAALLLLILLILSNRSSALKAREADGLRQQSARELEAKGLAEAENTRLKVDNAGLAVSAGRVPDLERDILQKGRDLEAERVARGNLEAELKTLKGGHEARKEEIGGLHKELQDKFASLAGDVLSANSRNFLALASERFDKHKLSAQEDLTKRQQAIVELVKPLGEKLGQFDQRMGEIEKSRDEAYGAIKAQVKALTDGQKSLGDETRKLVQALRSPKARGRWGEMQLKQVFEMAGMSEHVDFTLEHSFDTDEGKRRPDAIVNIPGGKHIVIDAKTPLEAYLDALETSDPEQQKICLQRHAGHVRAHVKSLASRGYQDNLATTPDFVVMFIPGETFVSAAAEIEPHLIEFAFENRVLIATPTTLLALIKSIAYGWQQENMAKNAAEVQKAAKEIYDRLAVFAGHLDRVGKSLGSSVDNYNKAVGSLEGRILPSARKFESLGAVSTDNIGEVRAVDLEPRHLTAAEFTPSAEELASVALPEEQE